MRPFYYFYFLLFYFVTLFLITLLLFTTLFTLKLIGRSPNKERTQGAAPSKREHRAQPPSKRRHRAQPQQRRHRAQPHQRSIRRSQIASFQFATSSQLFATVPNNVRRIEAAIKIDQNKILY